MATPEFLIDTNLLIYHTKGSQVALNFLSKITDESFLNISILTKSNFLVGVNIHLKAYKNARN